MSIIITTIIIIAIVIIIIITTVPLCFFHKNPLKLASNIINHHMPSIDRSYSDDLIKLVSRLLSKVSPCLWTLFELYDYEVNVILTCYYINLLLYWFIIALSYCYINLLLHYLLFSPSKDKSQRPSASDMRDLPLFNGAAELVGYGWVIWSL